MFAVVLATASTLGMRASSSEILQTVGVEAPLSAAQRELVSWGSAVKEWTAASPRDPHAQLARSVLLECLASPVHGDAFPKSMLSDEDNEACGFHPPVATLPEGTYLKTWQELPMSALGCEKAARTIHEKNLILDPTIEESQLRLAYLKIREPRTVPLKNDDPSLLRLATSSTDVRFKFLAELFLGLAAEKRKDIDKAAEFYTRAVAANEHWLSARYALASVRLLQGKGVLARDLLPAAVHPDPSDPWYGYSCRIMTQQVVDELRRRQRQPMSEQ